MGDSNGRSSGEALTRFADERGLTFAESADLPKASPLLIGGNAQSSHIVSGELPGFTGIIAAHTIQPPSRGSNQAAPPPRHVTVGMTRIPESVHYIPMLTARDAGTRTFGELLIGAGGLIPIVDRLEFESIKFNTTYRVGVLRNQDENFVRQLFPPTFLDYMAHDAPEGCYFDLMFGVLLVAWAKPVTDDGEVEEFCKFTARVAKRVRDECRESIEVAPPDSSMLSEPLKKAEAEREEWVGKVTWEEPPETVDEAARPYRRFARGRPSTWLIAAVIAAFFALLIGGLAGFFSAAFLGVYALAVFGGLGAIVFAWAFIAIVRGTILSLSIEWGLPVFARGYAAKRGLEWEPGSQFAARHRHAHMPFGGIAAALRGTVPGTERDGALVLAIDPGAKRKETKGTMTLATEFKGSESEALMIFPEGEKDPPTPLGGFLIEGVEGLRESDADRAARERREALAEEVMADEGYGLLLEGGELFIQSEKEKAHDWTADDVDAFAASAVAVAERLEAELAPKPKRKPRRKPARKAAKS